MSVGTSRQESAVAQGPEAAVPSLPASRPGVVRPAERSRRAGATRPGGRRGGPELPVVRPRVGAGGAVAPRPVPAVVRRRRAVAVLALGLLLAALVALAVALVPSSAGTVPSAAPSSATTVTVVGEGESLSAVARRAAPGADTAATVERIRELNGLSSSAVTTGRPLVVPAG